MIEHTRHNTVSIPTENGSIDLANDKPFVLFAGPCAMESKDHAIDMAGGIKEITDALGIQFVYKSSVDDDDDYDGVDDDDNDAGIILMLQMIV